MRLLPFLLPLAALAALSFSWSESEARLIQVVAFPADEPELISELNIRAYGEFVAGIQYSIGSTLAGSISVKKISGTADDSTLFQVTSEQLAKALGIERGVIVTEFDKARNQARRGIASALGVDEESSAGIAIKNEAFIAATWRVLEQHAEVKEVVYDPDLGARVYVLRTL